MRRISELLDVETGWDGATGSVTVGKTADTTAVPAGNSELNVSDYQTPAFVGDIYTSYVNPQASFDGEKIVVNEYDAKYDAGMITSKSGKYSNMGTNYLLSDMIFTEFPQFKDELISEIKNGYISCISYNGSVYIDAVNAIQFFRSKDIEIYGSGGYFYEVPNN